MSVTNQESHIGAALAMAEVCGSHPTSRTFVMELSCGRQVHICFTTIDPSARNRSATLHKPSNLEINQATQQLANHRPLHTY